MTMTNDSLIKSTKEFLNLFKTNVRFIFLTSLLFLILGFIFSFSLSPKFEIYAEILPKEDENLQIENNNSLMDILSKSSQKNDLSFFQSKMYSSQVAKVLWDMGYDQVFFSSALNVTSNLYELEPSTWQKIKSKILGYEINTVIDHQNFSDFIESTFTLKTFKDSSSTYLITLQKDPSQYLNFLRDLMEVTDNQIKQDKLMDVKRRIQFLTAKVKTTDEVPVQTNLMALLERTLLQEVLLSDESYYSIQVLDAPQISRNPSFINLQFIYFGFSLLGFLISIIYLYIRKLFFNISY